MKKISLYLDGVLQSEPRRIDFTNGTGVSILIAEEVVTINATLTGIAGILSPANGGTGVANDVLNTLTFTGAFSLGITLTGNTGVTFPTSGTLSTLSGAEAFTNKTSYNGLVITSNTGAVTSGTWNATSITTGFTDAKIKGAIAATAGLIPYGTGTADTVTSDTNFRYSGSNLWVGRTTSSGTDVIIDALRTVAATSQVRVQNASTTNGAYCQFTVINSSTAVGVINIGMSGINTTTSGVYIQGQAYNMTNSGGYSFGTVVAGGVVRMYAGAGVLCFTVDSSSHFTMADAKNIKFNTSTGTKIADGTTQKFAFWNKTPIVQPTTGITGAAFTANAGTAVNDASTFGGYTLQQMAAILINTGLAA